MASYVAICAYLLRFQCLRFAEALDFFRPRPLGAEIVIIGRQVTD